MNMMNMRGFTADASLYKLTRGYLAAPNRAAVRGGAVTPALMKRICTQPNTTTTTLFGTYTFEITCSFCQWWQTTTLCKLPGVCSTYWTPVGDQFQDCHST